MINDLQKLVHESKKIVAFTGAGFSAESGIPTYRGADGLWSKYDPSIYADIHYFMKDSTYYWNFFRDERYPIISKAKPNEGHYVLLELQKKGKLFRVITQNIDGLHQLSGTKEVIELHGTTRTFRCLNCSIERSMEEMYQQLNNNFPPTCSCGGAFRPNTIMFGEPLNQNVLEEAINIASHCDLFLVLGSSLVVNPASQLPGVAKKHMAKIVIINIDPTPFDYMADLVFHNKASIVLKQLVM